MKCCRHILMQYVAPHIQGKGTCKVSSPCGLGLCKERTECTLNPRPYIWSITSFMFMYITCDTLALLSNANINYLVTLVTLMPPV